MTKNFIESLDNFALNFDKLKDKNSIIPFSIPNYQSIRRKSIMMAIYNIKNIK